jgi:multiple sugar transport system permease protein
MIDRSSLARSRGSSGSGSGRMRSTRPRGWPFSWSRAGVYVALTALSLVWVVPFVWMISTSLKTSPNSIAIPPQWIPDPIEVGNYPAAFEAMNFLTAMRNTLFYALPAVVGTVASCSLVAYGFSRIQWPGRDIVFVILLATMMLPSQVTFIPLYVIFVRLGWVGTFLPLIIPTFLGNPFFIFLLRQFFLGIPSELSDAARIDGASEFRILTRIIVPLSWPALITVGLLTFIDKWTDFFGPLVYLRGSSLQPLSIAILTFESSQHTDWPLTMAASVAMTAPLVVIYFLAQRKFTEGITLTGLKG